MTTEAISRNVGKLFSELKLVTDNLLFIYAEANWEATESSGQITLITGTAKNAVHVSVSLIKIYQWNGTINKYSFQHENFLICGI